MVSRILDEMLLRWTRGFGLPEWIYYVEVALALIAAEQGLGSAQGAGTVAWLWYAAFCHTGGISHRVRVAHMQGRPDAPTRPHERMIAIVVHVGLLVAGGAVALDALAKLEKSGWLELAYGGMGALLAVVSLMAVTTLMGGKWVRFP